SSFSSAHAAGASRPSSSTGSRRRIHNSFDVEEGCGTDAYCSTRRRGAVNKPRESHFGSPGLGTARCATANGLTPPGGASATPASPARFGVVGGADGAAWLLRMYPRPWETCQEKLRSPLAPPGPGETAAALSPSHSCTGSTARRGCRSLATSPV